MKTIITILLCVTSIIGYSQQAKAKRKPNSNCISYYTKDEISCRERGGGVTLYYTNQCAEDLYVFIAVERNNGDWSTGGITLKSGKKSEFIVCNASANIVLLTRKLNENSKFPTYSELRTVYSKR